MDVITTDLATQDNPSKTQRSRILRLLTEAHGAWVSLPEIMACAAQYNARIFELRRQGFLIENRTEAIDEARHSWFRLVSCAVPEPSKPKPEKPAVEWAERPRTTGLPLFDLGVRG